MGYPVKTGGSRVVYGRLRSSANDTPLASTTWVTLPWDIEDQLDGVRADLSDNALIAPNTGQYRLSICGVFYRSSNVYANASLRFLLDGAPTEAIEDFRLLLDNNAREQVFFSVLADLSASTRVHAQAFYQSTGVRIDGTNAYNRFELTKVGA